MSTTTRPEHSPHFPFGKVQRSTAPKFKDAVQMLKAEHYLLEPDEFVELLRDVLQRLYHVPRTKRDQQREKLDRVVREATGDSLAFYLPEEVTP